ncbi:multidrug effflux MFS transporter [Kordiimonas pumila]|uniref:Bcr/CflA family efflux transporter n=1 Tax=Kordiimonas pumila TaxID=2161677 RepID=A0ABV7D360_9PROT|nr:multidrug effflux MFS transporter [Kordiimonas pumila]
MPTTQHDTTTINPNSDNRPYVKRPSFIISLAALTALTATAIDIALPAQPLIAESLGERAAAGGIIVSTYMLGYGPGQLLWGPLADRFGRIPPLMFGLVGFILATIACILSPNLETLSIARGIQGIFGGSGPVIARAIARDQGGGKATANLLTTIMMIFGIAPLLAPIIGSTILAFTEWQGIFVFLVLFSLTLIFLVRRYIMPATKLHSETSAPRRPLTLSLIIQLITARDFLMGMLVVTAIMGGYGAMLSIGALMASTRYGISATEFGPLFATASVAIVIGPAISRQLLKRYSLRTPMKVGAVSIGIAGFAFLLMANTSVPLAVYWVFVFLYMISFGLIMPISNSLALEPAGDAAGTASSLLAALPTIGAAAGAALASSTVFTDSYQALSLIMATGGICTVALVLLWDTSHRRGVANQEK